ncbi:MAG TPA: rod shape-determining protein MreD [Acidimicrobiia bacterium]|nr:rod shape-determining protein MreD [Acidimicrobiia bacterium]
MRGARAVFLTLGLAVVALVVQATVFRRFELITPDLVVVVVILAALSLRPEAALVMGFLCGLLVDISVGTTVLGLRALTYTAVSFLAVQTRHRADSGPVAAGIWVGLLSLVAVTFFLVVGILFGQSAELGGQMIRRLIQVPLANLVAAIFAAVPITRLLHTGGRRA